MTPGGVADDSSSASVVHVATSQEDTALALLSWCRLASTLAKADPMGRGRSVNITVLKNSVN